MRAARRSGGKAVSSAESGNHRRAPPPPHKRRARQNTALTEAASSSKERYISKIDYDSILEDLQSFDCPQRIIDEVFRGWKIVDLDNVEQWKTIKGKIYVLNYAERVHLNKGKRKGEEPRGLSADGIPRLALRKERSATINPITGSPAISPSETNNDKEQRKGKVPLHSHTSTANTTSGSHSTQAREGSVTSSKPRRVTSNRTGWRRGGGERKTKEDKFGQRVKYMAKHSPLRQKNKAVAAAASPRNPSRSSRKATRIPRKSRDGDGGYVFRPVTQDTSHVTTKAIKQHSSSSHINSSSSSSSSSCSNVQRRAGAYNYSRKSQVAADTVEGGRTVIDLTMSTDEEQEEQEQEEEEEEGEILEDDGSGDDHIDGNVDQIRGKKRKRLPCRLVPCRFFALGDCWKGDKCRFLHDPEIRPRRSKRERRDDDKDETRISENNSHGSSIGTRVHKPEIDEICRRFQRTGRCVHGEKCWYIHER